MKSPWKDIDGKIITCSEKLKVLDDAIGDIMESYLSGAEDAVLMGVDMELFRENVIEKIDKAASKSL